ncbi:MAG: ribosome-associated ATPase/putative transporter RbbA [Saccharospirillaceae bacterium]|nr:ribosome-associated ATPase/putative transporter RbbA [Saccharospirillaceae bacterium]MCD8529820.1 ribosome-associated ATPase/putative transporter RbbA [Saccharospirillaceae bacterium]
MNQQALRSIVSARNLSHMYGKIQALAPLDIDIPAGVMAGFIGPDGVGKSTLLSLITGVCQLQTGQLTVLNGDINNRQHRSASLPRIAYMPQGLGKNLYPTLSVAENLDFFGHLFGQDKAERNSRIQRLTQATGLAPFLERPAGKLSGGMKQKLGLCCALIHDPDLLVLDEPTTGVDPLSRMQFWQLIQDIRRDRPQMSVLVATAYMEEAQQFDWLAAMDDGQIIATGTPQELLDKTGCDTLEKAFIALLPEEKRAGHHQVVVPPAVQHDGPPAIEARHLTRRFGDFIAVNDVSFRIQRGEIFGFLGSNGCGKTTTMKMLTGLLPFSSGEARLFGQLPQANDMETRKKVGYMSQSFSLYSEISVRQNLELHARLYALNEQQRSERITHVLEEFGLTEVENSLPESLPLGIRQRLQLAVAVLHQPDILILDEPTSGVDPVARDQFWIHLIRLSREQGVTIFISTHFMNEAERCDRISLMHAGKVLAVGKPAELAHQRGGTSLEIAFVDYLREAAGLKDTPEKHEMTASALTDRQDIPAQNMRQKPVRQTFSLRRWWAYAWRETLEIQRDPIRLLFALFGPLLLMLTFGYGISFDVDHLKYAVIDQDQSRESRMLLEGLSGSRYFDEQPAPQDFAAGMQQLRSGQLSMLVEIPPDFGRHLLLGWQPEIGVLIDGAMPFKAETSAGYVDGLMLQELQTMAASSPQSSGLSMPVSVSTRFHFNQSFKSVFAIVPGVVMLMLALIPAMMTALGIVREKETGSIANFRSTPVTRLEFLLGKQAPYVAIAFLSYITLLLMAVLLFQVPVRGSLLTLSSGALLYVWATTGFGMVISSFTRTQVAALFAAAVLSILPAVNFSGLLTPVSSLTGASQWLGLGFPSAWFQQISMGSFTKALTFSQLWHNHLALAGFVLLFTLLAWLGLKKQER